MRKLLTFFILIIALIPLSASSLRVGLYNVPKELSNEVASALELFLSNDFRSSKLDELCYNRLNGAFEKEEDLKIHKALIEEKTPAERSTFEYKEFDIIECIEISENSLNDAILSKNIDALNYIKSYNELDLIFIYSVDIDGPLSFIELFVFDGTVNGVLDSVFLTHEEPSFYENILLELGKIYYPEVAFVRENGNLKPVNAELSEYELKPGEITEIEAEGVEIVEHSQLLFSIPYDAKLSVFAIDSSALPIWINSSEDDLIVSLNKDGFEGRVFQLDNSQDSVHALRLTPQWIKEDGVLKSAKDDFYRALRNTFLCFSLYAISSTINNINSDIAPWGDIIKSATAGISIVSLINLIKSCGVYYNRAKETYL